MTASLTRGKTATRVAWSMSLARLDVLLLVVVLTVAGFFRFWQQGQVPPGMDFDEAFESLEAHRLLTQPGYHPIFFAGNWGVPPLKIYLTALAFLLGGEHTLAIRYVSAVVGTLTILVVYLLARKLLEPAQTAGAADVSPLVVRYLPFVSALLLAVLPWHTSFSRRGIEVVLLPLWAALAVYFLWQGLQTQRWPYFALSGAFWGSVFYTYQAGWMLPGLLPLFVLYKVWQERGFLRRHLAPLLLLVLVAVLVVLPLANYAYHNPEPFSHRTNQVGLFAFGRGSETPLRSLANSLLKVGGFFFIGGDVNLSDTLTGSAPLPLALALALVLGCAVALRRGRQPAYALLLLWFAWMLAPSIITEDAPSMRRAIGSTPPMVILIALGLGWCFDRVRRVRRPWRGRGQMAAAGVAGVAIVGLLIYTVAWSYHAYFVDWGRGNNTLYYYYDVALGEIGQYAAASPANTRLYYTPIVEGNVVHLPIAWQLRDRNLAAFDGRAGLVLAPPLAQPILYLITPLLGDRNSLATLQSMYPAGRVAYEARDLKGALHSLVFAVPAGAAPRLAPQNPVGVNFANQVRLLGSDLSATRLHPGDALTVTLYWQATGGPTAESHTVFTHLVGPVNPANGSPIWAGHDRAPLQDSYPTTRWAQGETVIDHHTLTVPPEAPAGVYRVETGLYTPQAGGVRLPALDAAGQVTGDSVLAGSVEVIPRP